MNARLAIGLFGLLSSASMASAQAAYPMVMSLKPVAVQLGTTAECEVQSRYSMLGTHQVFISGTGISAEVIPPDPEAAKKTQPLIALKLRFSVEPTALPGVREFRLAAPSGASTVGQLVVVRDPVVVEQADNNVPEKAQTVTLPATLCGVIEKSEDVDFFRFHAQADEALSFHVRSQRLEDKIHDLQEHSNPILFLKDAGGGLLAMSDNTFHADPFLAHQFTATGDYLLEIRDARYKGNQYWEYCVEANSRPFAANVFPLAIAIGKETSVEPAGWLFPRGIKATVSVPPGTPAGLTFLPLTIGDQPSPPVSVYVSDLPQIGESAGDNQDINSAQPVTFPAMINGRIETEGDLDTFSFTAQKGDRLNFEVIARRAQSQLDPIIRILKQDGGVLREEDDSSYGKSQLTSDPRLEGWEAPADGTYVIDLRDVHLRGGPGYPYVLQITPTKPYFELQVDTDKTQLSPGMAGVLFVRVKRFHGFAGEVDLHIDKLPAGVTATCGRILAGPGLDGAIVLEAASDAPLSATNVRIWGTARHPQAEGQPLALAAEAMPYQEVYSPGGGRIHWPVESHTVNVGAPADLLGIELSDTDVRLKPGESKKVAVKLKRADNMKHNITLDMQFKHLEAIYANSLPEGVTIDGNASQTLLTGADSEGSLTLRADANAPPAVKQLGAVMANISLNFVMKATYSSPPVFITVESAP